MEKGYELWEPDEHKGFKWVVPPPLNGHIGAIQLAIESIDLVRLRNLHIEWFDPNVAPQEIKDWLIYKHVLVAGAGPAIPGFKGQGDPYPSVGGCSRWVQDALYSTCRRTPTRFPSPYPRTSSASEWEETHRWWLASSLHIRGKHDEKVLTCIMGNLAGCYRPGYQP